MWSVLSNFWCVGKQRPRAFQRTKNLIISTTGSKVMTIFVERKRKVFYYRKSIDFQYHLPSGYNISLQILRWAPRWYFLLKKNVFAVQRYLFKGIAKIKFLFTEICITSSPEVGIIKFLVRWNGLGLLFTTHQKFYESDHKRNNLVGFSEGVLFSYGSI